MEITRVIIIVLAFSFTLGTWMGSGPDQSGAWVCDRPIYGYPWYHSLEEWATITSYVRHGDVAMCETYNWANVPGPRTEGWAARHGWTWPMHEEMRNVSVPCWK